MCSLKNKAWTLLLLLGLVTAMTALPGTAMAQAPNTGPVPDEVDGWYENGRLYVNLTIMNDTRRDDIDDAVDKALGMPRRALHGERFGNRIGTVVPVRIRYFVLDAKEGEKPLKLDISQLKASPPRLTFTPAPNGDNWIFANPLSVKGWEPLQVVSMPAVLPWGGHEFQTQMTQINCLVQTAKKDTNSPNTERIPFWMEFKYAIDDLPGSGGPDWKAVNTPSWVIDMSPTADPGPQLSLGDLTYWKQDRPVVLGLVLIGLSVFAVSWVLVRRGLPALRGLVPGGVMDASEELWRTLNPILERTKVEGGYEFNKRTARAVLDACLTYISHGTDVNVKAFSYEQFTEEQHSYKDGALWRDVLTTLKAAGMGLNGKAGQIKPARAAELVKRIRIITTGKAE
jgi:hypothetical protein